MFEKSLLEFIENLRAGSDVGEWYLSEFIEINVESLSCEYAYNMTSFIIDIINEDYGSTEIYELIQILRSLQLRSDTTQKPKSLLNIPNFFNNILDRNKEDYVVDPVLRLIEVYG